VRDARTERLQRLVLEPCQQGIERARTPATVMTMRPSRTVDCRRPLPTSSTCGTPNTGSQSPLVP
jgi:hypothetical protein